MTLRRLFLLPAAAALAAGAAAQDRPAQPVADAGPFQVVVDRITHNRGLTLDYRMGGQYSGGLRSQRNVQLQVAVHARGRENAGGLATFQVRSVFVERAGRLIEVPYYGGPLETPNDPSLVRAYLYIPALLPSTTDIRLIEGDIVSYDRTGPVQIDLPLGGDLPVTVEKEGVKATLHQFVAEGNSARLLLTVEAPANTVIANTASDGSYGVSLLNTEGRLGVPGAGTMLQARGNHAEYRLSYSGFSGRPGTVRVRFLHRGGQRRVHPFRLERVPLALKPAQ